MDFENYSNVSSKMLGDVHEILPQPEFVSASTYESFVSESVRVVLELIRQTITTNENDGQENYAVTMSGKKALIGLAGGTTPRDIYRKIGQALANCDCLDRSKLIFFLVDERYVPSSHEASNTKLVKDTLLKDLPDVEFLHPECDLPYAECISKYNDLLSKTFEIAQPTAVLLGLGPDGHIGSWFPPMSRKIFTNAYGATMWASGTSQDRFPIADRISVSMRLILSARWKLLLLNGEVKVDVYKRLTAPAATRMRIRDQPLLQLLRSKNVTVVSNPPIPHDELVEMQQKWNRDGACLTVIVLGASGDLAKKKTFPALFSLYAAGHLPANFHIAGYARSEMTVDNLMCKIEPYLRNLNRHFAVLNKSEENEQLERFRQHLSVHSCKAYDDQKGSQELDHFLRTAIEAPFQRANRLFYLALPPDVFVGAVKAFRENCWSATPKSFNRIIVEKPFGRDSESSEKMAKKLGQLVDESVIYRIDHYLGKEMVLNLLVVRFANIFLQPLWNNHYVKCVRVTWKETGGTAGRGGYFDHYGIIRDVIQNHLLQVVTLIAMERPVSLQDEDIRDEKVKVLRAIRNARLEDTVVGQYTGNGEIPGYTEDDSVPHDSVTPTFATTVMYIDNERWYGVPFIVKAGKALESSVTEVRIQLAEAAVPNFFNTKNLSQNELVIRIQPNDAIYMKCMGKRPGLGEQLVQTELDLSVLERLGVDRANDAYERLLLDVVKGDKRNFVRSDELREAWRILTPLLHRLEGEKIKPLPYVAGSKGPEEAYELIKQHGYVQPLGYHWQKIPSQPSNSSLQSTVSTSN